MPAPTGISTLDRILGGGLPRNRATLVTGGPATGKSTLAMQFLQEGLEEGESCLFVTTEQTVGELRDSFAPFGFDLEHDNLTIVSVHATYGETIENEDSVVLENLGGDSLFDATFAPPFELEYVKQFLQRFSPADRVAFDSVSGLRPMADDAELFRRSVLELIRLFTDEYDATTLLTAERGSGDGYIDALQFAAHGVIECRQTEIGGDYHKLLRVVKLRGVDHDTREFGMEFTDDGLRVVRRGRDHSPETSQLSTGIPGFDTLTGGLVCGGTAVFEHDGRATLDEILVGILHHRVARGDAVVLLPPATMTPQRIDGLLSRYEADLASLLWDDDLFVLDVHDVWQLDDANVLTTGPETDVEDLFETVDRRTGGSGTFVVKNASTLLHATGEERARHLRYWIEGTMIGPQDVVCDVVNYRDLPESLVEFYVEASQQTFRTWLDDTGLQFLKLEKGPSSHGGTTRLVEFTDESPFVRVQGPPSDSASRG